MKKRTVVVIIIAILAFVITVVIMGAIFVPSFPTEIVASIVSGFMVGIFGFLPKLVDKDTQQLLNELESKKEAIQTLETK